MLNSSCTEICGNKRRGFGGGKKRKQIKMGATVCPELSETIALLIREVVPLIYCYSYLFRIRLQVCFVRHDNCCVNTIKESWVWIPNIVKSEETLGFIAREGTVTVSRYGVPVWPIPRPTWPAAG